MNYIRQATKEDVSRIAEILVFNKRINYRPIFQNDDYSFGELQVIPVANEYLSNKEKGNINMRIDAIKIDVNGHELLLRIATEDDAQILLDYLKTTSEETRFLVREPEEITMTLEQEKAFINSQNDSEKNLMLIGFYDGEYVGNCSFIGNTMSRYGHRASMAIALYQKYTGLGIGSAMIKHLLSIAKEKGIEQMELEVVADNTKAIALYKKMGFEIFGTFPDNMKYKDGTYTDTYWMMKKL